MIVHALSVLSVQAQVSSLGFLSINSMKNFYMCFFIEKTKEIRISALVAFKKHRILRVWSAMWRRDWTPWGLQKVSEISRFSAIFTYFVSIRGHRTHKNPSWSHLELFGRHLGAILEPSGSQYVEFGYDLGRYPRLSNAQEAILELFGSHF